MVLSVMPVSITLVGVLLEYFLLQKGAGFYALVAQLPVWFVQGMLAGLIIRLVVLGEHPVIRDTQKRLARNRLLFEGGFVFASVQYILGGISAGMLGAMPYIEAHKQTTSMIMPLAMGFVVFLLWGMRWLWLYVPVALGWDVKGFYQRLGGWGGSFRVMALLILGASLVGLFAGVVLYVAQMFGGAGAVVPRAISGILAALLPVLMTILSASVCAVAVKTMLRGVSLKVDA